jgi:hypothetical protein
VRPMAWMADLLVLRSSVRATNIAGTRTVLGSPVRSQAATRMTVLGSPVRSTTVDAKAVLGSPVRPLRLADTRPRAHVGVPSHGSVMVGVTTTCVFKSMLLKKQCA